MNAWPPGNACPWNEIRVPRRLRGLAGELAAVSRPGSLHGAAETHGRAVVEAALATLERLADLGWRAVVGDPTSDGHAAPTSFRGAIGGDAVAERTETFDPLATLDRRV